MRNRIDTSLDVYKLFEFMKDYEHEELWLLCVNENGVTGKFMLRVIRFLTVLYSQKRSLKLSTRKEYCLYIIIQVVLLRFLTMIKM